MGSPATELLHFQTAAALNGRSDTPQRTAQGRPKVHDEDQGSGLFLGWSCWQQKGMQPGQADSQLDLSWAAPAKAVAYTVVHKKARGAEKEASKWVSAG